MRASILFICLCCVYNVHCAYYESGRENPTDKATLNNTIIITNKRRKKKTRKKRNVEVIKNINSRRNGFCYWDKNKIMIIMRNMTSSSTNVSCNWNGIRIHALVGGFCVLRGHRNAKVYYYFFIWSFNLRPLRYSAACVVSYLIAFVFRVSSFAAVLRSAHTANRNRNEMIYLHLF